MTHFGKIENIVKDMFDGSDLYLVRTRMNNESVVKTYKEGSLRKLKSKQ